MGRKVPVTPQKGYPGNHWGWTVVCSLNVVSFLFEVANLEASDSDGFV